jgi:hypothetical protein
MPKKIKNTKPIQATVRDLKPSKDARGGFKPHSTQHFKITNNTGPRPVKY